MKTSEVVKAAELITQANEICIAIKQMKRDEVTSKIIIRITSDKDHSPTLRAVLELQKLDHEDIMNALCDLLIITRDTLIGKIKAMGVEMEGEALL